MQLTEREAGLAAVAGRHHRLAGLRQAGVDRIVELDGQRHRIGAKVGQRGQPADLELGDPEVLGQPVVQLPGEPGALLEHRAVRLGILEPLELQVRLAQRTHGCPGRGLDPEEERDVEGETQQVATGDHARIRPRIERQPRLGEGREDQADRQVRLADVAVAEVETPGESSRPEEERERGEVDQDAQRVPARGGPW